MIRSFLLAIALTGSAFVLGLAPQAHAEDKPDLSNIGFALYTKGYAPGTLNARWMFTDRRRGAGIATGGPAEGYAGRYHVRYFYDSGLF